METKIKTKTLAFDVRDIEQFKEYFPDFKSGKMSARVLGGKLIEMVKKQAENFETPSVQACEDGEDVVKHETNTFHFIKHHFNLLKTRLAKKLTESFEKPLNSELTSSERQAKIRLKHSFKSSETKTKMYFHIKISKNN